MRCYSHLSDDEREQIGLAKAVGHSIGAIANAIGRPKSTVSRELSRNKLPSGRYSPLHAAGAYQLRRRREADPRTRGRFASVRGGSARRGMDARTDLRLVEIWERTAAAGRRLRDNLRLHLPDRTEGRGLVALSDASP